WDDLWPPDGNTSPGYDLEWRRFQSALVTDLLHWQAALVRELARPDQFVTQDFVAVHGRPESDVFAIMRALDVMAINPYHLTQDGLDLRPTTPRLYGAPEWMGSAATEPGVWRLYLNADFARGVKERSFLVTELNALSIGGAHANYPAYDGQWRLVAYALIARGATLIAYWHWHTLHYSNETYWGGVLGHDLQPGRAYAEVQRIAAELRRHDALLTDLRPDAGVAFLYSQDSKYALEFQPALARPGTNDPDPRTYGRVFDTFYQSFFEARAQAVVLHPEQTFAAYPVLVVPALYIADEALLARLVEYAQAGGHLLLTFRSGYADALGRIRWTRAPGPLRAAVGASYQEYSNLVTPLPLTAAAAGFDLPAGARALAWADGLLLEGATPLAMYDHPHFGRFPAVVSQALGCGRVTYCGTLPNAALGTALARWVLDQAGVRPPLTDLPAPVRVTAATAADGRRLLFVSNWSAVPQRIAHLALAGTELFTGAARVAGDALPLEPWDTRIIIAS
ncbi:MAG TPA: beta-galactosidase trimerization domain-containing protein, partial [Chloroflexia bacterium]|nr:beta-galactosidase trimerization domain-containing protein [Chloroflexia bacterium]